MDHKKKTASRFLNLFLSAAMVLGIVPVNVHASGNMTQNLNLSENDFIREENILKSLNDEGLLKLSEFQTLPGEKILNLNTESENLKLGDKIFENIPMDKVIITGSLKEIGDETFKNTGINDLYGEKVENIGRESFSFNRIKTVNLNNLKSIGYSAFMNNEIEEFTTNAETVYEGAFLNNNLKTLNLLNDKTVLDKNIFSPLPYGNKITVNSPDKSLFSQDESIYLVNPLAVTVNFKDSDGIIIRNPENMIKESAKMPFDFFMPEIEGYIKPFDVIRIESTNYDAVYGKKEEVIVTEAETVSETVAETELPTETIAETISEIQTETAAEIQTETVTETISEIQTEITAIPEMTIPDTTENTVTSEVNTENQTETEIQTINSVPDENMSVSESFLTSESEDKSDDMMAARQAADAINNGSVTVLSTNIRNDKLHGAVFLLYRKDDGKTIGYNVPYKTGEINEYGDPMYSSKRPEGNFDIYTDDLSPLYGIDWSGSYGKAYYAQEMIKQYMPIKNDAGEFVKFSSMPVTDSLDYGLPGRYIHPIYENPKVWSDEYIIKNEFNHETFIKLDELKSISIDLESAPYVLDGYIPFTVKYSGYDGKAVFDNLPEGEYIIKEIQAPLFDTRYDFEPSTYIDVTGTAYAVISDSQPNAEVTFMHEPRNSIKIKKNTDTKELYNTVTTGDAVFALMQNGVKIQEARTGNMGGNARFLNVPAGHYTIVEVTPPALHTPLSQPVEVDFDAWSTLELTFENHYEPYNSNIVLKKVNTEGEIVPQAFFGIYIKDNGQTVCNDLVLDPGFESFLTYESPFGDTGTGTIYYRKSGCDIYSNDYYFETYTMDYRHSMWRGDFGVYSRRYMDKEFTVGKYSYSRETGEYTFIENITLPAGVYGIDGTTIYYPNEGPLDITDPETYVTVSRLETLEPVIDPVWGNLYNDAYRGTVNNPDGSVYRIKYGDLQNIRSTPDNEPGWKLLRITQVNDKGEFNMKELPPGEFMIKEIMPPEGYALSDEKIYITLGENETKDVEFVNTKTPESGTIIFSKTDADTGLPAVVFNNEYDRGRFSVYNSEGVAILSYSAPDENMQIILKDLPFGEYTIKEDYAPDGYIKSDEEIKIVLTPANAEVKTEMKNRKWNDAEVTLVKVDRSPSWSSFNAEPPEIYEKPARLLATASDVLPDPIPEEGVYYYNNMGYLGGVEFELLKDGAVIDRGYTDQRGYIIFKNLEAGIYTLHEVKTVFGFKLLEEDITLKVDDSYRNNPNFPSRNNYVINEPKPASFELIKIFGSFGEPVLYPAGYRIGGSSGSSGGITVPDLNGSKDTVATLDGAVFEIVRKDGQPFNMFVKTGTETTEKGPAVSHEFTTDNGFASAYVENGVYIIKEIAAPFNMVIPDEYKNGVEFTVDNVEPVVLKPVNYENTNIQLKVVKKGGKTGELLPGALFAVYKHIPENERTSFYDYTGPSYDIRMGYDYIRNDLQGFRGNFNKLYYYTVKNYIDWSKNPYKDERFMGRPGPPPIPPRPMNLSDTYINFLKGPNFNSVGVIRYGDADNKKTYLSLFKTPLKIYNTKEDFINKVNFQEISGTDGRMITDIPKYNYEYNEATDNWDEVPNPDYMENVVMLVTGPGVPSESPWYADKNEFESVLTELYTGNITGEVFNGPPYPGMPPAVIIPASEWVIAGLLKSDDKGEINFKALPEGEYKITEIEAPEGYVLSSEEKFITITDTLKTETVEFTNNKIPEPIVPGEINIRKTFGDDFPESAHNNGTEAVFELLYADGSKIPFEELDKMSVYDGGTNPSDKQHKYYVYDENNTVSDIYFGTSENDELKIMNVPSGNYLLREVKSPPNFRKSDEPIPVKADTVYRVYNVENTYIPHDGEIHFKKTDGVNPMPGIQFGLFRKNDGLKVCAKPRGATIRGLLPVNRFELFAAAGEFPLSDGETYSDDGCDITIEASDVELDNFMPISYDQYRGKLEETVDPYGNFIYRRYTSWLTEPVTVYTSAYNAKNNIDPVILEEQPVSYNYDHEEGLFGIMDLYDEYGNPVMTPDEGYRPDYIYYFAPVANIEDINEFLSVPAVTDSVFLTGDFKTPAPDNNSGWTFVGVAPTDENGEINLYSLPEGTYRIEELVVPEGYKKSQYVEAVITEDNLSHNLSMVNEKIENGSITVIKTDALTGEPLSGAEFSLLKDEETIKTGITDEEGILIFDEIPYGEYTLQETKAPAGYRIPDAIRWGQTVELSSGNAEVRLEIKNPQLKNFRLIKVNSDFEIQLSPRYNSGGSRMADISPLYDPSYPDPSQYIPTYPGMPNTVFKIRRIDNAPFEMRIDSGLLIEKGDSFYTIMTKEAGLISGYLPDGNYVAEEIKPAPGFIPEEGFEAGYEFTIGNGSSGLVFAGNRLNPNIQAKIIKKDEKTGEVLRGAYFAVYRHVPENERNRTYMLRPYISGIKFAEIWGTWMMDYLPEYYNLNKEIPYQAALYNSDYDNYDMNGIYLPYYYDYMDNMGEVIPNWNDADGKLLIFKNYILNFYPFPVEMVRTNPIFNFTVKPVTVYRTEEDFENRTNPEILAPGMQGPVSTYDDIRGNPDLVAIVHNFGTENAVMYYAYRDEWEAARKTDLYEGSVVGMSGTDMKTEEHIDVTESSEWVMVGLSETNDAGEVNMALLPEGEYKAVEILPPAGYMLSDTPEKTFTVTDVTKTETIEFFNKKEAGNITVIKKDSATGELLQGAEFTLTDSEDNILKGITDENGKLIFTDVKPGSYKLQEITAPKGYKLSEEIKDITVNGGDNIEVEFLNIMDLRLILKKTDTDGNVINLPSEFSLSWTLREEGTFTDTLSLPDGTVFHDIALNQLYTLTETKAPEGYRLNNRPETFTVSPEDIKLSEDGTYYIYEMTFTDYRTTEELPGTGTFGVILWSFTAGALTLLSLIPSLKKRRVRK